MWDVEFRNRRIAIAWNAPTVPPVYEARPRFDAGRLTLGGRVNPTHIVMSSSNPKFAPQGAPVADNGTLTLFKLAGPPAAAWVSRGIDKDGWTVAGRPTLIRVFGRRRDVARLWMLRVLATDVPATGRRVDLEFGESRRSLRISGTAELKLAACIPPDGSKTAFVRPRGSSPLGGRRVGIRVIQVRTRPTTRTC